MGCGGGPRPSRRHGNGARWQAVALSREVRAAPGSGRQLLLSRGLPVEDSGFPRRPPFRAGQGPGALRALAAAPRS